MTTLLFVLTAQAAPAAGDDGTWTYDADRDVVRSRMTADGIRSTIRIEHRGGQPWLVWTYEGAKPISRFEIINIGNGLWNMSGVATTSPLHANRLVEESCPDRACIPRLRHEGGRSIVEFQLELDQIFQLGDKTAFSVIFFYTLEGDDTLLSWHQLLGNKGSAQAIAALLKRHDAGIRDETYGLTPPPPTASASTPPASGTVLATAPAAVVFSEKEETATCSFIGSGLWDIELSRHRESRPGLTLKQFLHSLNCTRNKRAYAPGKDFLRLMLDVKHIGVTYHDIVSVIVHFERAGPDEARYLSNFVDCKQLIMKRCGRGCYRYAEARTLWQEIEFWRAKYPTDNELRLMLNTIRDHLRIHMKRFPVKHSPKACPAFLTKRVATKKP